MPVKKYTSSLLLAAVAAGSFSLPGCVTAKKHEDLRARQAATEQAKTTAERQAREAVAELQKATSQLGELRLENRRLVSDSAQTGNVLRRTQTLYRELSDTYEKLIKNNEKVLANKSADYQKVAQDLARREAELGELSANLNKSRSEIDKLSADVKTREQRLAELEKALAEKDAAVNALRSKVSNALLAFKSNELQVKVKDGKVYVSLSEQLLFKSGSTKVDPKGQEALTKLALVLKEQPDVNVVVEGHTDNVPILRGTAGMQDNWDLSALRATEIARLLTTGGVQPERVTASGRSQYVPVAQNDSAPNKALNRRTEIILTPKLDELFQILGTNSEAGK
ncbi:cell envelope biogenesis protein OmpA [Hymenobacter edaphi]|uniref:Cell envelope biogenesis protein OmpA n=1 Tax=Hymenobacter edaphi TaxID=2211146 RepID=A0A328BK37_9BACT|nr:cell envelope biogenesis protein OmpA [Hymenobacter edaphi]